MSGDRAPERWVAHGTIVHFGDGGIDIRNAPNPERRARLIAAAPEMLEALQWVHRNAGAHWANIHSVVGDAIEKATRGAE